MQSNGDLTGENPDRSFEIFVATCGLVGDFVSLIPLADTFRTSADASGCPAESSGTFSFTARLASLAGTPDLTDLAVEVNTLSNGNLLQNADQGPQGIAARLTVPRTGSFGDGVLSASEAVDVPFAICLHDRRAFRFLVDVAGLAVDQQ